MRCIGRLVLAILMGVAALTAPAGAQEGSVEDQAAVRAVIERQLAAFHRDDAEDAFSYAAPGIREMFETSERFIEMVKRGYAPLYRSEHPTFVRSRTTEDGVFLQEVGFTGPNGQPWSALYTLERQPNGDWRISGCVLRQDPGERA